MPAGKPERDPRAPRAVLGPSSRLPASCPPPADLTDGRGPSCFACPVSHLLSLYAHQWHIQAYAVTDLSTGTRPASDYCRGNPLHRADTSRRGKPSGNHPAPWPPDPPTRSPRRFAGHSSSGTLIRYWFFFIHFFKVTI